MAKKICIWNMGTECSGEIVKADLFNKQLNNVPICEFHFLTHKEIMACHNYKFNIDKVIRWSDKSRQIIMEHFKIKVNKKCKRVY